MSPKRPFSKRGVAAALTKGGWKPKPTLSYIDGGVSVSPNGIGSEGVQVRCHTNESATATVKAILEAYAQATGARMGTSLFKGTYKRTFEGLGAVTIFLLQPAPTTQEAT